MKYTTLQQFAEIKDSQISIQHILNERIYTKELGWHDIEVCPILKNQICDIVVDLLGGYNKHKGLLKYSLMNRNPQHWGLDRIFVNNYGGKASISYCAGQDHPYELNLIRTYLRNL